MADSVDDKRAQSIEALRAILVNQARSSLGVEGPHGGARKLENLDDEHKRAVTNDLKTDTNLKKIYATWFIGILIGQLLIMNAIFVAVGYGCLTFESGVLKLYMGGTLAEVFGIVIVITRYLFPGRK